MIRPRPASGTGTNWQPYALVAYDIHLLCFLSVAVHQERDEFIRNQTSIEKEGWYN